jgi:hypothetical protein
MKIINENSLIPSVYDTDISFGGEASKYLVAPVSHSLVPISLVGCSLVPIVPYIPVKKRRSRREKKEKC